MDTARLRGEIVAKFKTQTAFANAMNWNKNKVTKMLNGLYNPDIDEVALIVQTLGLSEKYCYEIFLQS